MSDLDVPVGILGSLVRDVRAILPRSSLARASAIVNCVMLGPAQHTLAAHVILIKSFVLAAAAFPAHALSPIFRVGYVLHHPRSFLDPRVMEESHDQEMVAFVNRKEIAVPPYVPIPATPDLAMAKRQSCPTNTRGTSCFTDTPFVVVFMATDVYDSTFRASRSPDDLRPTQIEEDVFGQGVTADDSTEWCVMSQDPINEARDLLTLTRAIGWSLRMGGRRDAVDRYISILRDALVTCLGPDVARRQEDAFIIYEMFMSINGWARWHASTHAELDSFTSFDGVPLDVPMQIRFEVDEVKISLRTKLRPSSDNLSAVESLQELVNLATTGRVAEDTAISIIERATLTSIENHLRATGQETVADGISAMRLIVGQQFLDTVERVYNAAPDGTLPDDAEKFIHFAYTFLIDQRANYIVGRSGRTLRSRRREIENETRMTDESMHKFDVRSSKQTMTVALPPSGVLVLDATSIRRTETRATDRRIMLPPNRYLDVTYGWDGRTRTERYVIFAVIIKFGPPGGGHYTCAFWRDGVFFYYDDTAIKNVLQRIERRPSRSKSRRRSATTHQEVMQNIQDSGYFFFARRATDDTSTSPAADIGPPPGSPDVGDVYADAFANAEW